MIAPLQGIRVLEIANYLAAPSCAALMADMGAEVIKVEPPGGDAFRAFNLKSVGYDYDFATNFAFELDNRGKRSITVALDQPGGPEVVQRLAARADVVITNLVQRRREQYRLTVEDIQKVSPRTIYVSFTGYGTESPDADRAGFDFAAFWARSGIMSVLGDPNSAPAMCRGGQGDHTTALNLLAATLAALRMRDLTGEGQVVDVTLLATGMWTISSDYAAASFARTQPPRHNRASPLNPIWNYYRCADGKWVLLGMAQPDRYWPAFCSLVEHPEWIDDPRFATLLARLENRDELTRAIEAIIVQADLQTWAARFDGAGLIWAPVAELPDAFEDATVASLGIFTQVEHPQFGPYQTMTAPFRIRGADIQVRGPAPTAGADTFEVLEEYGFSEEEVSELATNSVFG